MKQKNVSGQTLEVHLPDRTIEVAPGEEIEAVGLIGGFVSTAKATKPAKALRKSAKAAADEPADDAEGAAPVDSEPTDTDALEAEK